MVIFSFVALFKGKLFIATLEDYFLIMKVEPISESIQNIRSVIVLSYPSAFMYSRISQMIPFSIQ